MCFEIWSPSPGILIQCFPNHHLSKIALQRPPPQSLYHYAAFLPLTGPVFDWDSTFDNIDDAVDSGQFSEETGDQIKESIRSFSMTFENEAIATAASDVTHFAIVRSISTSITQLRQAVVEETSSSGSSSARAPSPECDDEFISFE